MYANNVHFVEKLARPRDLNAPRFSAIYQLHQFSLFQILNASKKYLLNCALSHTQLHFLLHLHCCIFHCGTSSILLEDVLYCFVPWVVTMGYQRCSTASAFDFLPSLPQCWGAMKSSCIAVKSKSALSWTSPAPDTCVPCAMMALSKKINLSWPFTTY